MENRLWYQSPTDNYIEGLPAGNGRLAVMALGSPGSERFAFNHEWLWRANNRYRTNERKSGALPELRKLLKEEKYAEATAFANENFGGLGGISKRPHRLSPYQPLCDFTLSVGCGKYSRYLRELDLDTGVIHTSYRIGDTCVDWRLFISFDTGFACLSITADKPSDATLSLSRIEDPECEITRRAVPGLLSIDGRFTEGLAFACDARVFSDGVQGGRNGALTLLGFKSALVLIDAGTTANRPEARDEMHLPTVQPDYNELFSNHKSAFSARCGTMRLWLEQPSSSLPTDERVKTFKEDSGSEPLLPLLYFNYGRYLLVSGSSGELPLNLQGKWNQEIRPPWECDYHLDINLQMCYWPALSMGLFSQYKTLTDFCASFIPSARDAADKLYGCRGIYVSITTDAWGRMTPEARGWDVWIGAAPWLAQHMYRAYQYTLDAEYLKNTAYPFLKGVAEFYEDYLVDSNGVLEIMPSQSPENRFPECKGFPVAICVSSAIDVFLASELLGNAAEAADILGVDQESRDKWLSMRSRLPIPAVSADGRLLEWNKDFEEVEPGHRHLSHLYGLFPGDALKPGSPLHAAAAKSLHHRLSFGGGHTGWSRSQTACTCARLGRGDECFDHLQHLICDFATISLLDLHPPRIYQIDGNIGGTAAVCEMLIRSCYGKIELLPALPSRWPSGHVDCARAQGGFEVSFVWENGNVVSASVLSHAGGRCTLCANGVEKAVDTVSGAAYSFKF